MCICLGNTMQKYSLTNKWAAVHIIVTMPTKHTKMLRNGSIKKYNGFKQMLLDKNIYIWKYVCFSRFLFVSPLCECTVQCAFLTDGEKKKTHAAGEQQRRHRNVNDRSSCKSDGMHNALCTLHIAHNDTDSESYCTRYGIFVNIICTAIAHMPPSRQTIMPLMKVSNAFHLLFLCVLLFVSCLVLSWLWF